MSQGSLNPKIRFLFPHGSINPKIRIPSQNVSPVAFLLTHKKTQRRIDKHESEYRGHPFSASGIFIHPIIKDRSNNDPFSTVAYFCIALKGMCFFPLASTEDDVIDAVRDVFPEKFYRRRFTGQLSW